MKGKDILEVLQVIVIVTILISFISVIILLAIGEFDWFLVNDMFLRIAIILFSNAIMLTFVFFMYKFFTKRRLAQSRVEAGEFNRILQCAGINYMLPVIGLLLLVMIFAVFLFNKDIFLQMYEQGKIDPFQMMVPVAIGLISVIYLFYLSSTKVYYSQYTVKVMRFLQKRVEFHWADVREVFYQKRKVRSKSGTWEHITFVTPSGKFLIRADIFQDGWDDFSMEALSQVKSRQITLHMNGKMINNIL